MLHLAAKSCGWLFPHLHDAGTQDDVQVQAVCIHNQQVEEQINKGKDRSDPEIQEKQRSPVAPLACQSYGQIEEVHVQEEHAEVHFQESPPMLSRGARQDEWEPRSGNECGGSVRDVARLRKM